LSADEEFLIMLKEKCSVTDEEWEERQKTRQVLAPGSMKTVAKHDNQWKLQAKHARREITVHWAPATLPAFLAQRVIIAPGAPTILLKDPALSVNTTTNLTRCPQTTALFVLPVNIVVSRVLAARLGLV
jgi:hypothetical protein